MQWLVGSGPLTRRQVAVAEQAIVHLEVLMLAKRGHGEGEDPGPERRNVGVSNDGATGVDRPGGAGRNPCHGNGAYSWTVRGT